MTEEEIIDTIFAKAGIKGFHDLARYEVTDLYPQVIGRLVSAYRALGYANNSTLDWQTFTLRDLAYRASKPL